MRDAIILAGYARGDTLAEIAANAGCCVKTVSNVCRRHGVEPRGPSRRRGPEHPLWRDGVQYMHGYRKVWIAPDDPYREMANQRGWVLEHRLVMARHLGRALTRLETVHHLNGVRDDNRLENLQLWLGNHGRGSTYRCADCGSTRLEAV